MDQQQQRPQRETPDVLGALAKKPQTSLEETLAYYRKHGAPPPRVFEDGDQGAMTRPIAGGGSPWASS
jgi:hypothetical protein